jgi:putative PEP-CTERM system histidine kinase
MRFDTQLSLISAFLSIALAVVALARTKGKALADWALVAGLVLLALEQVLSGMAFQSDFLSDVVRWQSWRLLVLGMLPATWLLFSLCYARGNAAEFLRKWGVFVVAAFFTPVVLATVYRDELFQTASAPYLLRVHSIVPFGWAGLALFLVVLAGSVLVLMNLERTFRASVGTMRWRIKFMLMGIGLLFIVRIYTCTQALLFLGVDRSLESLDSAALWIAALLILRSLFRDRQSSPDIYPSHLVLQGSFTVVLVGAYLLIVGLFAKIVASVGGDASFAVKAFVVLVLLVLLAVVVQSDRVRLHVRRFLSRNFNRPSHDYRAVWRKFTEGMASEVEQTGVSRSLAKLVVETFQALSVSVWIVEENKESLTLAASTFLSDNDARPSPPPEKVRALLRHFRADPEPVDLEASKEEWAQMLKELHPRKFPTGGDRICVPLISGGDVLGFITIGDRVSGTEFTIEDFDMLTCVGGHASASILSAQMSRRLLMVKELEAFQTMAAFFVHDLKNAASTLNLMLQNLPVHFDDPAFREDALRGVGKTVSHINHLVSRLTSLRHELKMQPASTDFNAMVTSAIAGAVGTSDAKIVTEFSAVGPVNLDREQISKVVTNLVLNALESAPNNAPVRVATSQDESWAILAVSDQGCGMSPEFLSRSLFRPFTTTKKNGLGIGMFQSKMIVESHGGRIAVASEVGRGTTFQVFLPRLPSTS